MTNKAPNGYINKHGAAEFMGVKCRTIDNHMKRKLIPFYKFGRRVYFKEADLRAAIERSCSSTPAATTEPHAPIANVCRNECWDKVCAWLQICAKSPDPKQRNLATETLRFITKFDL